MLAEHVRQLLPISGLRQNSSQAPILRALFAGMAPRTTWTTGPRKRGLVEAAARVMDEGARFSQLLAWVVGKRLRYCSSPE